MNNGLIVSIKKKHMIVNNSWETHIWPLKAVAFHAFLHTVEHFWNFDFLFNNIVIFHIFDDEISMVKYAIIIVKAQHSDVRNLAIVMFTLFLFNMQVLNLNDIWFYYSRNAQFEFTSIRTLDFYFVIVFITCYEDKLFLVAGTLDESHSFILELG